MCLDVICKWFWFRPLMDWLQLLLRLDGQEVKERQVPGTHTRKNSLNSDYAFYLKNMHSHTHSHEQITHKNTHTLGKNKKRPKIPCASFQAICVSSCIVHSLEKHIYKEKAEFCLEEGKKKVGKEGKLKALISIKQQEQQH